MDKSTKNFGIDISKKVFDVWNNEIGHRQFTNDDSGFTAFSHYLGSNSWCVMEYTESYYFKLATFLYESEIALSVVNPLVVKRFIQMKLQRNKTDKNDAKMKNVKTFIQRLVFTLNKVRH